MQISVSFQIQMENSTCIGSISTEIKWPPFDLIESICLMENMIEWLLSHPYDISSYIKKSYFHMMNDEGGK